MYIFYSIRKTLAISGSILYLTLICCDHLCMQSLQETALALSSAANPISIQCQTNSQEKNGRQDHKNNHTKQKCDCCFEQVRAVKINPVQNINILPNLYSRGIIEQLIQVEYDYTSTVYFYFFNEPPPLLNGPEKRISIQSFIL